MREEVASGWFDDGSEAGAIRTHAVRGDLVRVPFKPGEYSTELVGATTSVNLAALQNPDYSTRALSVTVNPASIGNGFRLWQALYGSVVGVRWSRASGACDFTIMVDGVPYAVTGAEDVLVNEGVTVGDDDGQFVIENLADGRHTVEIIIPADASATRTITLYGWLLERRAGYSDPPRTQTAFQQGLTTTQTVVTQSSSTAAALRGIRKIIYTNISASSATVTVQLGGVTNWQKTIAAGDSAELDFGAPTALSSGSFKHAASAASAINAFIIGEGY